MTLEEAIFHAEEVAEGKDKEAYNWEYYYDGNVPDIIAECKKCATEHRQLAEWLKDYKRLLEQEPKTGHWIPVSKNPKEMGCYMTTLDYGEYGLVAGQRKYHGEDIGWSDECVIAWMPLPEPYKPQESEDKE